MIQNEKVTTGGNTTWATNTSTPCANRLPCGICRLMQATCPLGVQSCHSFHVNGEEETGVTHWMSIEAPKEKE